MDEFKQDLYRLDESAIIRTVAQKVMCCSEEAMPSIVALWKNTICNNSYPSQKIYPAICVAHEVYSGKKQLGKHFGKYIHEAVRVALERDKASIDKISRLSALWATGQWWDSETQKVIHDLIHASTYSSKMDPKIREFMRTKEVLTDLIPRIDSYSAKIHQTGLDLDMGVVPSTQITQKFDELDNYFQSVWSSRNAFMTQAMKTQDGIKYFRNQLLNEIRYMMDVRTICRASLGALGEDVGDEGMEEHMKNRLTKSNTLHGGQVGEIEDAQEFEILREEDFETK